MTVMSKTAQAGVITAETLWRQRFTRFAREALIYWRDVGRSGFLIVATALLIGGAYGYGMLLRQLPPSFPYLWVAVLLLAPAMTFGGVRTLLRPADRVFLLPLEAQIGVYFRRAFAYSFMIQAIKTAAALTLLWPLYAKFGGRAGSATLPYLWTLAITLLLKAAQLWADWHESRVVHRNKRVLLLTVRLLATAGVVPILFEVGLWQIALAAAVVSSVWLFLLYNSRSFSIGWNRLLEREAAQQRKLYRWFRWFTDVPQLPAPVQRRRWLTLFSRRLAIKREHTYVYLFEKTLLRTELFGMYARFTLVSLLLVCFIPDLWLKSAFLVGLPIIGLMQLSSLADAHRYSFWLELYPVPNGLQSSAVLALVAPLAVGQTAVLTLAYAFTAVGTSGLGITITAVPLLSLTFVLLGLRFRLKPVLQRKFAETR